MNRIREYNGTFQVLITPDIKISPDTSLLIGNWADENLRNYYVLQYDTFNDAMAEALNYPDIDWYKMVLNHKYIFMRLDSTLKHIISEYNFNVEYKAQLLDPTTLKNVMFDRVMKGGERFNLRYGLNDIIHFTIINPWKNNLHIIAKIIENYTSDTYRDDLRIRFKKIIDGSIIYLYGYTEFGTVYAIKLIPTLLNQATGWYDKNGFRDEKNFMMQYDRLLKMQQEVDNGVVLQ
jgi:hypothetical protein